MQVLVKVRIGYLGVTLEVVCILLLKSQAISKRPHKTRTIQMNSYTSLYKRSHTNSFTVVHAHTNSYTSVYTSSSYEIAYKIVIELVIRDNIQDGANFVLSLQTH